MSIENRSYGFLVGYDLENYPQGAHLAIISDIKLKYNSIRNENARRILDTTWVIKANTTFSNVFYKEIETIIKKHVGTGNYFLTIWKINFESYWIKMRNSDAEWFKEKFSLVLKYD